jgi:signal transduction histidine kinase
MIEPARGNHFRARSLLPVGFCGVFLFMTAALVDSYRMQDRLRASPAVFAAFDRDGALIERARRSFNQSRNVTREFLLHAGDTETFFAGLTRSETDLLNALNQIAHKEIFANMSEARASFRDHFQILRELASWSSVKRKRDGADFTAGPLSRLRSTGNRILRDLAEANQNARREQAMVSLAGGEAIIRRIFVLLAAGLILALCVAGLNLTYARELSQESLSKVQEIARANSEMQQLSARLLSVQEEERRRLSRDLHDGIGQLLTAVRIEISRLGHEAGVPLAPQDRERLRRARALAEEAVRNTRDIALLLRPSHLDDLGLEAALHWQAEDFSRRTGISCHFSAEGLQENLPEAWKTCVYRIVQEALHNCEKHAAPTQVHVHVSEESERITLEVQDDGVGFELNAQGAPLSAVGLGLLGMRERAAMLGGALRINSAPGRGVLLRVDLPEPSHREVKA